MMQGRMGTSFDPATIARYTSKVEVDPRYRAPVSSSSHKQRSVLSDLASNHNDKDVGNVHDRDHMHRIETTNGSQKRKYTEAGQPENNKLNISKDAIFSLPSFKKIKSNTNNKPHDDKSSTTLQSTHNFVKSSSTSNNANISSLQKTNLINAKAKLTTTQKTTKVENLGIPPKSTIISNISTPKTSAIPKVSTAPKAPTSTKPTTPNIKIPKSIRPNTTTSKPTTQKPATAQNKPAKAAIPNTTRSTISTVSKTTTTAMSKTTVPAASKTTSSSSSSSSRLSKTTAPLPRSTTLKTTARTASTSATIAVQQKSNIQKSAPILNPRSVKPAIKPMSSVLREKQPPKPVYGKHTTDKNEYDPDPIADREELGPEEKYWNNNYSSIIQNLFPRKYSHNTRPSINDDVAEVGFLDWEEEEMQSEMAGMQEDREEQKREKRRKLQKQKNKSLKM